MPPSKRKAAAKAPASNAAGKQPASKEYQAEKLTGKRMQKGMHRATIDNPKGTPKYFYEVKWAGTDGKGQPWENTFEPADKLVGWEEEMKAVDAALERQQTEPQNNPVRRKREEREAEAKQKAKQVMEARARLQRRKARAATKSGAASEGSASEEESGEEEDGALAGEALDAELARLQELEGLMQEVLTAEGGATLQQLEELLVAAGTDPSAAAKAMQQLSAAASSEAAPAASEHKRMGRSRVWLAFNRETDRCTLPHPTRPGETCNARPDKGTGTSGHIRHLEKHHPEEWTQIQTTGRVPAKDTIAAALAASADSSRPAVSKEDKAELDRLTARWIAKCSRPESIVDDTELQQLLARMLELCKARLRYSLPSRRTVQRELQLLGAEGRTAGRNMCVNLLKSGVKLTITGDLWSENGMGLFGIYAHGILESTDEKGEEKWAMVKSLIGLVACESVGGPFLAAPPPSLAHCPFGGIGAAHV